jgi:hypothetical protein
MESLGPLRRLWGTIAGQNRPDGLADVQIGDPRFDEWEVVRDFDELETARAFRQAVAERGVETVLTADWPLDSFGRGDIALRVPPGRWSEAEDLLELDADD